MGRYTVRIEKPQHKFSAAHFTIFSPQEAELLHGHNYRLLVELDGDVDERELLIPFGPLKELLASECRLLDERVLLPERASDLSIARANGGVSIQLGSRSYRFPEADVVMLPVANVTAEALARHLALRIHAGLAALPGWSTRLTALRVGVEESDGQSAWYAVEP